MKAQVSGDDLLVNFSASAVSGVGALLELVSGNNQVAAVGSALADSLVVRVTDDLGNPVAGVEVQWAAVGGGSISPASVSSGADGTAAAERVLGNASGPQTAEASSVGLASVTFTQTAEPANPTSLVLWSGDGQTGGVGSQLADSLVVRLVDDNGNAMTDREVLQVQPDAVVVEMGRMANEKREIIAQCRDTREIASAQLCENLAFPHAPELLSSVSHKGRRCFYTRYGGIVRFKCMLVRPASRLISRSPHSTVK